MRIWAAIAVLSFAAQSAYAQDPPVPPAADTPAVEEEIAPGFDEPKPKKPVKKEAKDKEEEAEEEDPGAPTFATEGGRNERFIEDINATRGEVTLGELVDEILADVVAELDRLPLKNISPMAIRQLRLSTNVAPQYAEQLRNQIIARLHTGTKVKVLRCIECDATHTRIENGQWIITRGVVTTEEMKTVGEQLGAKSFLDINFGFEPEIGLVEMNFTLVRASDASILWAEAFRADESTPMLLRSSEAPTRRKDRLNELRRLLEGRPWWGIAASAGFMLIPYNDPNAGDISGATAGFRVYERFGVERRVMFGLDLMGFINTSRLAGGIISAGAWWIVFRPDLVNPELRLGGKGGAFIAGSQGNAAMFQLGAEVLLKYRFGLYLYGLFMTKSMFNGFELGGIGASTGLSFNW